MDGEHYHYYVKYCFFDIKNECFCHNFAFAVRPKKLNTAMIHELRDWLETKNNAKACIEFFQEIECDCVNKNI